MRLPSKKVIFKLLDYDYHFAINKEIRKLIDLIADSITRLEQSLTTLDKIYAKLIIFYIIMKNTHITENCNNSKAHMIKIIQRRASKFNHPIYFVVFFWILNINWSSSLERIHAITVKKLLQILPSMRVLNLEGEFERIHQLEWSFHKQSKQRLYNEFLIIFCWYKCFTCLCKK